MKKNGLKIILEEISKQYKMIKGECIMTQKNIDIMDKIADELVNGKNISEALKTVYRKRNVGIPFSSKTFDIPVEDTGISVKSINALRKKGLKTVNDVITFASNDSLKNIPNFGHGSARRLLEFMLNIAWNKMSAEERVEFLMDTVERNEENVHIELM